MLPGLEAGTSSRKCVALAVLTIASVFNFADRQIVSILAQSIKGDLLTARRLAQR
jgi:hypothetical protein